MPISAYANPDLEAQCRICYLDGTECDDLMISPCNCAGTMGNVHLGCLQLWFSNKTVTRVRDNCKTFSL